VQQASAGSESEPSEEIDRMAMALAATPQWENIEWRRDAACRDVDPNLFFPVGVTGPAVAQIAAAKSICEQCPATGSCLEFAITTNQEFGVWGGTTEDERRVLRRRWRAEQRRNAVAGA
jgi:WhiB family redox-sensing transcriptional regulator